MLLPAVFFLPDIVATDTGLDESEILNRLEYCHFEDPDLRTRTERAPSSFCTEHWCGGGPARA